MPQDVAYDLILQAATHPLLGDNSASAGTLSAGATTTIFSDGGWMTYTNDSHWRNYKIVFPDNIFADRERVIYSHGGALGQVQVMQPLSAAPASGARYLLLRDFGPSAWSTWLDLLNETCRSLYFDRETYLRGISTMVKYSLPVPISRGEWIEEVFVGDFPFAWSRREPVPVRWHRLNPLTIQQDLYLILEAAIDASSNLVFLHQVPFAHPDTSAFTMSRSVLTPFGETSAINAPRDLLVAGMVWRALRRKVQTLTGDARKNWEKNLEVAARQYAEKITAHSLRAVGLELGYSDRW